ncbi:MAG: hypothetical protein A2V91_02840 [Candidatus Muproteobacteria bacterium RBG_16_64_10]|uniref:Uncharacterized protein n=1 Tax=Candidatus Muproteobacteria bacterium RBG_16_64_10 TaxID=1817757 RepID=A0A1F6T0G6_9PROT|nr:MAG: hypothetical protein A2V91_02840 [Candidatus Muproteobacteria bacterium RBG_16_64_10]
MKTIFLLTLSNVLMCTIPGAHSSGGLRPSNSAPGRIVMTFAWYAHLKDLRDKIAGSDFGQRSRSDAGPSRVSGEGESQGWGEHKPWIGAAYIMMFRQPLTGGA